jgi:hypothetical protein
MDYKIYVRENQTGKPIAGARVDFLDYPVNNIMDLREVVTSYITDASGIVTLVPGVNDFEITNAGGLAIWADGYGQAMMNPGPLDNIEIFELYKSTANFPWWLLLVGGGLVYLAAERKPKIAGVDTWGGLGLVGVALAEMLQPTEPTVKF